MIKYRYLVLLLIILGACKKETKQNKNTNKKPSINVLDNVKRDLIIPTIDYWDLKGVSVVKTNLQRNNEKVYRILRTDTAVSYAFAAINNVKIGYSGGNYKINVIVKRGDIGSQLGVRIQGVYPTRTDVVFDLKNHNIKKMFKEGDLTENEKSAIEDLGEGWFKCVLTAKIKASYFKLVFGPTSISKNVKNWESLTDIKSDLYIIPSSLKIEELMD